MWAVETMQHLTPAQAAEVVFVKNPSSLAGDGGFSIYSKQMMALDLHE